MVACGGAQAETTTTQVTTTTSLATTTSAPATTTTAATTTSIDQFVECDAAIEEARNVMETFFERVDADPTVLLEDDASEASLELFGDIGELLGQGCFQEPGRGQSALIVVLAEQATVRSPLTVSMIEAMLEIWCAEPVGELTLEAQAACVTQ